MAEQTGDWIVLREGNRTLYCSSRDHWDRITMLAVLSSDPRSIEELAIAWSRYRADDPLKEWPWEELWSAPPADVDWLFVDLQAQCFGWHDEEEVQLAEGAYTRDKDLKPEERELIWMNIPPWWRQNDDDHWPLESRMSASGGDHDFRQVLFGRELSEGIAHRVLCFPWNQCDANVPKAKSSFATPGKLATGARSAGDFQPRHPRSDEHDEDTALEDDCDDEQQDCRDAGGMDGRFLRKSIRAAIQKIHAEWLMTPHLSLHGSTPRDFLHLHREWKERELDFRRAQWSHQRRPPTPVPVTSHLFRRGPMGIEEVVAYFDLCRELVTAAWRWHSEEPSITPTKMVEELEQFKALWLSSETMDGDGESAREVIEQERRLLPRLASSDPIDCDCPLCRLQQSESDMFGPAFSICDGYHLDLEDEFAFSLYSDHDEWEASRSEWARWDNLPISGDDAEEDEEDEDDSEDDGETEHNEGAEESIGTVGERDFEFERSDIWKSSMVGPTNGFPALSIFSVGSRLTEIISELKRLRATQEEIDRLNDDFDALTMALRGRSINEAKGKPAPTRLTAEAVKCLVQSLECMALQHPQLIPHSADLQSMLHQWQRELSALS